MDSALEQRSLDAEDGHWWYRGRRRIVLDAVRRVSGDGGDLAILDAGCGGGAELAALSGRGTRTGMEPSPLSRRAALERGAGEVLDATIEDMPFAEGAFDLALALDVLEHVDDDRLALGELRRVVRPGGSLIVTVPAYPRLWTRHDDLNEHRRRYTSRTLRAASTDAGWSVERVTHFNMILLPVSVVSRRRYRHDGFGIPPAPVNVALQAPLQLERLAIRARLRLPAGLSLLAELRR
jgi:SAM-dependent methyltransferase